MYLVVITSIGIVSIITLASANNMGCAASTITKVGRTKLLERADGPMPNDGSLVSTAVRAKGVHVHMEGKRVEIIMLLERRERENLCLGK
jgi:hypothetical protein